MIEQVCVKGEPKANERACIHCRYMQGALSWWCVNKKAADWRGTNQVGVHDCPFWKPVRKKEDLSFWERWFGSWIGIDCTEGVEPRDGSVPGTASLKKE
jgi:hypothetical protein